MLSQKDYSKHETVPTIRLSSALGLAAVRLARRLTAIWHGPGESDCLIKTKHYATAEAYCWQNVISECTV